MIVFVLFLFLIIPLTSAGQTEYADSLRYHLEHAPRETDRLHAKVLLATHLMQEDREKAYSLLSEASALEQVADGIEKADYHNALGLYHWHNNHEKAIRFYKSTLQLADDQVPLRQQAVAANNIGALYNRLGRPDSARVYLVKAYDIDLKRNNLRGLTKTMYDLAVLHLRINQYDLALQYILDVIDYQEAESDSMRLTYSYNIMGRIYQSLNDYEQALRSYEESVLIAKAQGVISQKTVSINNILALYASHFDDHEKVGEYFTKGIKLAEEATDYNSLLSLNHNMGVRYRRTGEHEQALDYYRKAMTYFDKASDRRVKNHLLKSMGKVFISLVQTDSADYYLNRALQEAQTLQSKRQQSEILLAMSELDSIKGVPYSALRHYKQGIALRDSIMSKERLARVEELLIMHETERKDYEIQKIQQRKKLRTVRYRNTIIVFALLSSVIFLAFTVYYKKNLIARKNFLYHKKEKELQDMMLKAQHQEICSKVFALLRSQDLLESLKTQLHEIKGDEDNRIENDSLNALRNTIMHHENNNALWYDFQTRFNELSDGFINRLAKKHPSLSPSEIRLCAMLRMQLSSKEIAEISNRTIRTIEQARFKVRKKMGLSSKENLTKHILNI